MTLVATQLSVAESYLPPVLREPTSYPPQMIISFPVHIAVCSSRSDGALLVPVFAQLSFIGLYRPPLSNSPKLPTPPQTIISLLVQTAVCETRAEGALMGLVPVHVFVAKLYFPPVFVYWNMSSKPPQTIISLPVHTAV